MRRMTDAFLTHEGAEVAVKSFSQRKRAAEKVRARAKTQQSRVLVACIVAVAFTLSGALYVGLTQLPQDGSGNGGLARGKTPEEIRAALRFGEIRVPIAGNSCLSYDFDNKNGDVISETPVRCVDPLPPPASIMAEGPGRDARAKALSNAFKK